MAIGAPPLVVIGAEGLWGTVLTICLIYPLAYKVVPGMDCNGTCYEDPFDSLAMITHNINLLVGLIFEYVHIEYLYIHTYLLYST